MKVQTNTLSDRALNYTVGRLMYSILDITSQTVYFDTYDDDPPPGINEHNPNRWQEYTPSSDWAQGGPIIESNMIDLYQSGNWVSEMVVGEEVIRQEGPTPLVAAMRCFVASKVGNEVDIPDELV